MGRKARGFFKGGNELIDVDAEKLGMLAALGKKMSPIAHRDSINHF